LLSATGSAGHSRTPQSLSENSGTAAPPLRFRRGWLRRDPEHFHLLIGEPDKGNPSLVMQVLKQRVACRLLRSSRTRSQRAQNSLWDTTLKPDHLWQRRFYDFVVWTQRKRVEKLRYMHRNPVKRGLVLAPEQWAWSSFRYYAYDEAGPVLVDEKQPAKLKYKNMNMDGITGKKKTG